MKKIILLFCSFSLYILLGSHTNKKTDEGMFLLNDIRKMDLKQIGLNIPAEQVFNPGGTSLTDAIVRVGGCTGSFVSDEGLIVTNHHCAFGYVQAISTTKHNYIRDGYLAESKAQEAPAKGLVCKITASYEDVSDKVLQGTKEVEPSRRLQMIRENMKKVTEAENKLNPDLQCEISEMFTGRTYMLFRYKLLKDVRLVYVPARSIGEYGGEVDNWVWPRHSGDFAFLRAYVAPDGSVAEYNEKNVPYHPKKFLKVNPKGVKENDFVFILGYPGRTFRHQPAAFYEYHEKYMLQYISNLFDWEIAKMEEMGKGNDSISIKYAGRIKSLANTTKNYKGKLQGFRRTGLTAQKYRDEKSMQDFVDASPELKSKYGNVIPQINQLYSGILKNGPRNLWYSQIFGICPSIGFASALAAIREQYNSAKPEDKVADKFIQRIRTALSKFETNYDPAFEPAAFEKMLQDAGKFDADNKVQFASLIAKEAGKIRYTDWYAKLLNKSKLTSFKEMEKMYEKDPMKLLTFKDPLIDLIQKLNEEVSSDDEMEQAREAQLNRLMSDYADMKSNWKGKQFVPDANSTLRFTYGHIKGYWPNDADYNAPFTTLKGVLEKEDGKDFVLMDVIRQLYAAKDFGPYMHPDLNDLPVNILYDLDTTGGNSGSPVLNANGELIGVNFDRAYTATINDYAWNESYSRSVAVDIRYVLWIVSKVAKADHIIKELGA